MTSFFPGLPHTDELVELKKESRQDLWILLLGQLGSQLKMAAKVASEWSFSKAASDWSL